MKRFWIDGEWNSFGGELLSLAIVTGQLDEESGDVLTDDRFYMELVPPAEIHPWVQENVMPHLSKTGKKSYQQFQRYLGEFLNSMAQKYGGIELVSDWPEDIMHVCKAVLTGPGETCLLAPISFNCRLGMYRDAVSAIPHHAFFDACSNMELDIKRGYC